MAASRALPPGTFALLDEPLRFVAPESCLLRYRSRRLGRYSYMIFKDGASAEEGARFLERTRLARPGSVEVRRVGDMFLPEGEGMVVDKNNEGPRNGAFMGQEKRCRP